MTKNSIIYPRKNDNFPKKLQWESIHNDQVLRRKTEWKYKKVKRIMIIQRIMATIQK